VLQEADNIQSTRRQTAAGPAAPTASAAAESTTTPGGVGTTPADPELASAPSATASKGGRLPRSLGAARHPFFARLEAVVERYGARKATGGYLFPSRRAAREAASEILGELGGSPKVMRLRDYEGLPERFQALARKRKSSLLDSVIGQQRLDGSAGWRDDFLGHVFEDSTLGPHVNIWDTRLGVEEHLFYPAGSPAPRSVEISW
jgi:hypothetical protein